MLNKLLKLSVLGYSSVVDPVLEIRGEGGCHPDPEIKWAGGGGVLGLKKIFLALWASVWPGLWLKKIFLALWASVWSKNKRGLAPWAPPLDPPLQLCLCHQLLRSAVWITQFCPHSVLLLVFLSSKAVSCCCCYFPCWT